ncbi:2TM domain-containing protein [Psychroserpens algicola]|uniref:2TM domain-containing protein n=1 Tax=Psychroserpens algicola TaxID=1719034 RepID=A0ABT0H557_9FLAO|nr:2TM domain-containing protein [Psychroserpens algicola]MCK8479521.1 2TM domain-containing protein [Psychroserpens algicola]
MALNNDENKRFLEAKRKVQKIKIFYLHVMLYLIVIALISYNFYILEGPYTDVITGLNISVIVFWTIFIVIHAWSVYKGRFLFNKSWEDKKIEKILEEKNKDEVETKIWE